MTFKKSYVPGILGSVLTLTVIMAAPVKAETKEETILNKQTGAQWLQQT